MSNFLALRANIFVDTSSLLSYTGKRVQNYRLEGNNFQNFARYARISYCFYYHYYNITTRASEYYFLSQLSISAYFSFRLYYRTELE